MNPIRAAVLGALLALAGASPLMAQTTSEPTETEISNIGNDEILRLLALAKLAKEGVSAPTDVQLTQTKAALTVQRTEGMGWGAMANAMGLRLGEVISSAKRNTPEKGQAQSSSQNTGGSQASSSEGRGNAGGNGGGNSGGRSGGGSGNSSSGSGGGSKR